MKAVIIASDYLKDTDGSYKVLEVNTNALVTPSNLYNYTNFSELDQIISSNNITTVEYIHSGGSSGEGVEDLSEKTHTDLISFSSYLINHISSSLNIPVIEHSANLGVVPDIEDSDSKLVIRQAYDQTAVFDTTYAKDNYEFLKLMHDTDINSIPKTYIPNVGSGSSFTFDSVGTTARDNGVYPNFLIKQRYPTDDYVQYPVFHRLETSGSDVASISSSVAQLKSSLQDGEILQEYIFNTGSLVHGNKLVTYRSVDLLYGSTLQSASLMDTYIQSNRIAYAGEGVDYISGSTEIQAWERPKFLQKLNTGITAKYGASSLLLSSSLETISGSVLTVSDTLSQISASLENLHSVGSGSYDLIHPSPSVVNTDILAIDQASVTIVYWNAVLTNGTKVALPLDTTLVIKDGELIKMTTPRELVYSTDDNLIPVYNKNTQTVESYAVSSSNFSVRAETGYAIDVNPNDTFLLSEIDGGNDEFIIVGNACACYGGASSGWYCASPCGANAGSYSGASSNVCCNNYPQVTNGTQYYIGPQVCGCSK